MKKFTALFVFTILSAGQALKIQEKIDEQVQQSATLTLKAHQQIKEKVDEGALVRAWGTSSSAITNLLSTNKQTISDVKGQVAILPWSPGFQLSNAAASVLAANQTLGSALASLNQQNLSFAAAAAAISQAMTNLNTTYQNVVQASTIVAPQNGTINNLNYYLSPASGNAQTLIDNYNSQTGTINTIYTNYLPNIQTQIKNALVKTSWDCTDREWKDCALNANGMIQTMQTYLTWSSNALYYYY